MKVAKRAGFQHSSYRALQGYALTGHRTNRSTSEQAILGLGRFLCADRSVGRLEYAGSVERIVKDINVQVRPERVAAELSAFFAAYLCCTTVRNDDAHTKNFGLLYSDLGDIRLVPVYDLFTSSMYAPADNKEDSSESMALTFTGTRKCSPQI